MTLRAALGEPTLITDLNIAFAGAILQDRGAQAQMAQIQETWPLNVGMCFSQGRWDAAKQQALRQLTTWGYPTGQIAESTANIASLQRSARLGVVLDSGPTHYFIWVVWLSAGWSVMPRSWSPG